MLKNFSSQYIFAFLLLAFASFQLTIPDYWEFSLYFSAGMAFLVMGLIKNNVFPNHGRRLTILSWILIIAAGLLLLFLARTDY